MTTKDKTFTAFTLDQAAEYASGRGSSYPPELYETIRQYHRGTHAIHMDVGTGPGKVVFDMLPYFTFSIGVDPSVGMVEQAEREALSRGVREKTRFVVCGGEDCDDALTGTVDVVTSAMAVHWMDVSRFYASAAKALRSGGTLTVWTCSSLYCHPSTPRAGEIQALLGEFEDVTLREYHTSGTLMSRQAYETLPLPWSTGDEESEFDRFSFLRRDWDLGGVPSAAARADGSPGPFLGQEELRIEKLEKGLAASSAVVRWREANLEKAHTEEDVLVVLVKRLKDTLGANGSLVASPSTSLLLMRRS